MRSQFMTTARAKGLSENALLLKHCLRLAILPVVWYSGPLLADLLTGSFVIESIFQLPGLGTFLVNGSLNRDYTLVVRALSCSMPPCLLFSICWLIWPTSFWTQG